MEGFARKRGKPSTLTRFAMISSRGSSITSRTTSGYCGLLNPSHIIAPYSDMTVSDLSRLPAFQAAAVVSCDGVPTEPFTLFIDPPKTYEGDDLAARFSPRHGPDGDRGRPLVVSPGKTFMWLVKVSCG